MKRKMFYGADPAIFDNAKALRNSLTHEEVIFWNKLKDIFQFKFRRQHPISIYIAGFYCHKLKLVIEIDGPIHNVKEVARTM